MVRLDVPREAVALDDLEGDRAELFGVGYFLTFFFSFLQHSEIS